MTIEEKIDLIRLRIADVPSSPLYPIFSDQDLTTILNSVRGDVDKATKMAAIGAAMQVAQISTREVIDDLTIENNIATNYLAALKMLIANPVALMPIRLVPWSLVSCSKPSLLEEAADLSCSYGRKTCCSDS